MIKGLMSLYPNPSNFNWLTASHSIQDLLKKLRGTIESKDNELQTKEQQLNEAKQQELLTSQAKLEFELNAVRTKDSRIVELEIKVKLKSSCVFQSTLSYSYAYLFLEPIVGPAPRVLCNQLHPSVCQ